MKKKIVVFLAACLAYAASASVASAFMQNWALNADGTGFGGATTVVVNEYLDTIGNSLIRLTPTGGSSFSFVDYGFFTSSQHDGGPLNSPTFSRELTSTFTGSGTGNFGGTINFNSGGVLSLYSDSVHNYGTTAAHYGADDGTLIAQFRVTTGDAAVNQAGLPNGTISISFQADAGAAGLVNGFLPGYFFDDTGNDLSSYVQPLQIVLGFATTNASTLQNPSATLVGELNQFSGLVFNPASPLDLLVSNNGQYRLDAVPEPGTLALLSAGLLGLTIFGKRRRMNKES